MTGDRVVTSYDPDRLDLPLITGFVQTAYWGEGRDADKIARSIARSHIVGFYDSDAQIGFARAVSDGCYFAYVMDLVVLEPYRGRGLGRRLIEAIMAHPELREVEGWMLATRSAHAMYEPLGFERVDPDRYMRLSRSSTSSQGTA